MPTLGDTMVNAARRQESTFHRWKRKCSVWLRGGDSAAHASDMDANHPDVEPIIDPLNTRSIMLMSMGSGLVSLFTTWSTFMAM